MWSSLSVVDVSTLSMGEQDYNNGSCLILGDKELSSSYTDGQRNQAVFWTMVICIWGLIIIGTVLGIPGNILSAAVFYRQGLRERINLCLFSLSVINLVILVALVSGSAEYLYRHITGPAWVVTPYTSCLNGALWASQFLSAVIASERCFCVVSPFHAKRLLKTTTMAAIIVVCCVLLTAGMCAIATTKHKNVCVFHPSTKVMEQVEYITEFYQKNKAIIEIFDIFIYSTGLSGIFLVVIIVSTCITAVKLRTALTWRLTTASKTTTSATATTSTDRKMKSKEVNVTLMLMATSMLFTVCMSANFLIQICRLAVPGFNYDGEYFLLISPLYRIIFLLWALNLSLNFVVYYKMGSKFRDTINDLLRLKRFCTH